jgi:hypothetical protein
MENDDFPPDHHYKVDRSPERVAVSLPGQSPLLVFTPETLESLWALLRTGACEGLWVDEEGREWSVTIPEELEGEYGRFTHQSASYYIGALDLEYWALDLGIDS